MTIEERLQKLEKELEQNRDITIKKEVENILTRLFFSEQVITTTSSVPTAIPTKFHEQFVLYVNGATNRLYVYVNGTGWLPITL